jgi:hypothetical protein
MRKKKEQETGFVVRLRNEKHQKQIAKPKSKGKRKHDRVQTACPR